jgi:hypothetical protein
MAFLLNKDTDFQSQIILSLPFLLLSIPFLVSFLICFFLPSFYLSIQLSIKYKVYLYADDFIPRRPGSIRDDLSEISGGQSGTETGFSPSSSMFSDIIPPLPHTHLSPLHGLCDSPDRSAHYHALVPKLRAPCPIRDNAGVGVNKA